MFRGKLGWVLLVMSVVVWEKGSGSKYSVVLFASLSPLLT